MHAISNNVPGDVSKNFEICVWEELSHTRAVKSSPAEATKVPLSPLYATVLTKSVWLKISCERYKLSFTKRKIWKHQLKFVLQHSKIYMHLESNVS